MDAYKRGRKRLARHERKRELLRNPHPFCSVCGEDRLELLQLDHTAGDANGELTNWLCFNHHAGVSDRWHDTADLLRHDKLRDHNVRLASLLQGLVYFFDELIIKLREWIAYLLGQREVPR
jgi:hypothetical protein